MPRYRYQTVEFGEIDIHLRTLRDHNEFDDPDGEAEALGIPPTQWPLFGVVWASSIVLARVMVDIDIAHLRILEVGCGIGLASLVLNHRGADVTALDWHPEAGRFLAHNTALNDAPNIAFHRSDWHDAPDLGLFDLIIGSDLLYGDGIAGLSSFADAHAAATSQVILVDPGRGHVGGFKRAMAGHDFSHSARHAVDDEPMHMGQAVDPRIQIHTFRRG